MSMYYNRMQPAHSTFMPILLLKELLRFYRDNGNNMYVCFF